MSALFLLLTAGVLALQASGLSAAEDKAPAGQGVPQSECFCVQLTGGALPPYFIGRMSPPAPECAAMKYQPNGKAPWENGLLSCDELLKCGKVSAKYAKKKKILADKTSQAKEKLKACCAPAKEEKVPAASCDNKCSSDWEGILGVLAAETEKLDKAERKDRELCLAKPSKVKEKNKRGMGAGN